MPLSDDAIWEFKSLYEKEFKESVSFNEAEMATGLLRIYKLFAH